MFQSNCIVNSLRGQIIPSLNMERLPVRSRPFAVAGSDGELEQMMTRILQGVRAPDSVDDTAIEKPFLVLVKCSR